MGKIASSSFVKRHTESRIRTALSDTRIVAVIGPRQSGKTTLTRRIAKDDGRPFITLDDAQNRRFAKDDPHGFTRGLEYAVIDEIQRAPDLLLALKKQVDEDPRPGRFLITGSVELFEASSSPDSLAGRVETVTLLPFSQAEIAGTGPPGFLDRAFAGDFEGYRYTGPTADLVERVLSGGFPLALARANPTRRRAWLLSYAHSLAERHVSELARVTRRDHLAQLVERVAISSGHLLNANAMAGQLGVNAKTVMRWITLLEQMFLVRRVPAWHHNQLKRLVRAPKLHFTDSGLLSALVRVDRNKVLKDRQKLGPLLESFVYGELAKAVTLSEEPTTMSHYRDKDGVEVNVVLERSPDFVVGIEIKAGASALPRHFKGLRRMASAIGDRFACGILLHDGDRVQQVAERLFAMPISTLWEA